MVTEELIIQQGEVDGQRFRLCARCDAAIGPGEARLLEPLPPDPAASEAVWLCEHCWRAVKAGRVDLTPEEP